MESGQKLRLGKIYQKFIILDILKVSLYLNETRFLLHSLSNNGRKYLKSNYTYIRNNLMSEESTYIDLKDRSAILYLKYSEKYLNFSLVFFSKQKQLERLGTHIDKFPSKYIGELCLEKSNKLFT